MASQFDAGIPLLPRDYKCRLSKLRRSPISDKKVKVGIIGTGNISPRYIQGCRAFDILDLVAVADIDRPKADKVGKEHQVPKVCSVEDLLADPEIQIVINLTVPLTHAEVSLSIIKAGKHPYSEKPLAVTREDGQKILTAAKQKGVRVGCAPDTFLFGSLQTCRKLIDDGAIGQPVAATGFMLSHGPEGWHPNPDFFYQVGGGPLFDMGPYYLTMLVNLLGAIRRVAGSARISFPERIATSQHHSGRRIPVEVPTHIAGTLDFVAGPVATLITSFDVWAHHLPRIEIYGSEGSLSVPDPNGGDNRIQLYRAAKKEWSEEPVVYDAEVGRGIGVADMAYGIVSGRPHRASGDLAFHVLDVMHALGESSASGQFAEIASKPDRPAALPLGLAKRQLDK